MYIKTLSGSGTLATRWKNAAQLYIKTEATVWQRVRQGYIKISSSTWKRFFYEANLPTVNTRPQIRVTNTGSGTIYDGNEAGSPQFLNADLFGKDGTYNNYTSITSRRFSSAASIDSAIRSTVVFDDRFTSAGGVTTTTRSNLAAGFSPRTNWPPVTRGTFNAGTGCRGVSAVVIINTPF